MTVGEGALLEGQSEPVPGRSGNTSKHGRVGPHSRLLNMGSLSGRSREGRYIRALETQLYAHLGGAPSITQRLAISRLARVSLRLQLFDEKIDAGSLTDHDARVYGALHNAFRLLIRELGLKPAAVAPSESLADVAAAIVAAKREGAPVG